MSGDGCETTQEKRIIGRPFQPGNSGRPKGSRNKLQESFLADVVDAWEANGKQAIVEMIADKPGDFVKMVASLMLKEANLNITDNIEMTDDELAARVRSLAAQLSPFLIGGTGIADSGDATPGSAEVTPRVH